MLKTRQAVHYTLFQSRGTSSGINAFESDETGILAFLPSPLLSMIKKNINIGGIGSKQCCSIFLFTYKYVTIPVCGGIDGPVLWLWTLRRCWVIHLGSGWHVITEDWFPQRTFSLSVRSLSISLRLAAHSNLTWDPTSIQLLWSHMSRDLPGSHCSVCLKSLPLDF